MSYTVARRTGEIGIRMALGAQRGRVVWMILREVVLLAAVGLAISVPAAPAASKLVEAFLFGMKSNDLLTLMGSAVTLLIKKTSCGSCHRAGGAAFETKANCTNGKCHVKAGAKK